MVLIKLFFSALFIGLGIKSFSNLSRVSKIYNIPVKAIVTDVVEKRELITITDSATNLDHQVPKTFYYPTLRYLVSGEEYEIPSNSGSTNYSDYKKGKVITIYCEAGNPKNFILSKAPKISFIGIIFIIFGICVLFS